MNIKNMKNRSKRIERELFNYLSKYGWKGRRLPASIVDGFATKRDKIALFEIKVSRANRVKISAHQVKRLHEWLSYFDYYRVREAIGAIKFLYSGKWIFIKLEDERDYIVKRNDKSNWSPDV